MCGIAAIFLHPQKRTAGDWQAIREVFTQNLLFNEIRGKAATGVALVQADGKGTVYKLPISATEFIETEKYCKLLESVDSQTTLLLGHTRHPTKGDPDHNGNNHPLQIGPVFGVHNGHIDNDDALFVKFGFPRQAEVDSEIIFRLLEPSSSSQPNDDYLTAIHQRLQFLSGKFTFLSCDIRAPEKLLVIRHHNPLSLHFHTDWNALIFSSRYLFLRIAFGRAALFEHLPKDQLLLFDAYALPQLGSRPVNMVSIPLSGVNNT